jgi:hypothetical protein
VEENPPTGDIEQFYSQFHTRNPILVEIEVLYYLRTADRERGESGRSIAREHGRSLSRGVGSVTRRRCAVRIVAGKQDAVTHPYDNKPERLQRL